MSETLLPANAGAVERALEAATARIGAVPVPIDALWNPATCPEDLLPWLAWALAVDSWDPTWPVATRRAVIAAAVAVHRRKGSVGSVQAMLDALGYPGATIIEGDSALLHDGAAIHDGDGSYGDDSGWARYVVVLDQPITNDLAAQVRAALARTAPARCHLKALRYTAVPIRYGGAAGHDGAYNHGAA